MKKYLLTFHRYLKEPRFRWSPGIDSIWSVKWVLVALCYLVAVGFMGRDPWFGDRFFAWNQGMLVILLSFIVVSTLCFEWHLMGRPEGINLLLQFLLTIPFALFLGRIVGRPWNYSAQRGLIGEVTSFVKDVLNTVGILSFIPRPVQEVFSSPGLSIFLLFVCLALSLGQRKATRIGLLLTAMLVPLATAFAYTPRPTGTFVLGAFFMLLGASFQFLDVTKYVCDVNMSKRLKHVEDEAERRCSIRITKRALEDGRITQQTVLDIVRRCYVDKFDFEPRDVINIARSLSQRLVNEHGLLTVQLSSEGLFFTPAPSLYSYDSLLAEVALWPRSIILMCVAFLWWLTPIDILPDAVPIFGTVDDVLILALGGMPLMKQISAIRSKRNQMSRYESGVGD